MKVPGSISKLLLALLFSAAAGEFIARGPVRIVSGASIYNDMSGSYIGAKAWIRGMDPYSNTVFWPLWNSSGGEYIKPSESIGSRTPYPWTCFLLLAPLSFLNWPTANMVYGFFSAGMVILAIGLLGSLPEINHRPWRRWLFCALALGLSPFHSGLKGGNLSIIAIAFFLISFWASRTDRPVLAGICCALSVCLKWPIGVFLALYYLVSGRWRAFSVAVAAAFVLSAAAISRLAFAGVPWLSGFLANSKLVVTDPINWITEANPKRFQMVNLQILFYTITGNERSANFFAILIGVTLLLSFVILIVKSHGSPDPVLALGTISVICLLPVYHRYYDAALLILPLVWSLSAVSHDLKIYQRLTLLLSLPFFFPGAWMLETWENTHRIPSYLVDRWWWDSIVMSHQIWAIFLLAFVLLAAMWKQTYSRVPPPVQVVGA